MGVQIFTVPSIVLDLVKSEDMLGVMLKELRLILDLAQDTHTLLLDCSHPNIRFVLRDTMYSFFVSTF